MSEERVTEALQALRRADRDIGLDGEAEVRTLLKFRRQQRRRRSRRLALGCALAALTTAAVLTIAASYRPAPESPPPMLAALPPVPVPPAVQPINRPTRAPHKPEEVVTPFFALLPSAPPLERGLLVRMTVPASAMRSVGLPVGEDHLSDQVLADVLVGQDDLARAIRFVSYQ